MGRLDLLRVRRDTAADWTAANPVLRLGEPGWETDDHGLKFGDGVTAWVDLDYFGSGGPGGAGPAGAPGIDGLDGAPGPAGAAGAAGSTGPAGQDGLDGSPGPAGAAGATGGTGPTGPEGLPGFDGARGPAGTTGSSGSDGAPGSAGAPGIDGLDGARGPAGTSGTSGTDGPPGMDGVNGAAGQPGSTGAVGPDGLPGMDGNPPQFDTTVPVTQAFGDAAAVGTATTPPRRDHKHAMPAATVTAEKFIEPGHFFPETTPAVPTHFGTAPDDGVSSASFTAAATVGLTFITTVPVDWASGVITYTIYWAPAASDATPHTVRWSADVIELVVGTTLVGAAGTTTAFTGTSLARVANTLYTEPAQTLLTPTTAGNLIRVNLRRVGGDILDTMTAALSVAGILLKYTANR